MSSPRSELSISHGDVRDYITKVLAPQKQVKAVWLVGSRSPLVSEKWKAREDSDWDLICEVDKSDLSIRFHGVREYYKIHADVSPLTIDLIKSSYKTAVQVWPEDTHGVFKNV